MDPRRPPAGAQGADPESDGTPPGESTAAVGPYEARVVLAEARRWRDRGLLPAASFDLVQREYAALAARPDGGRQGGIAGAQDRPSLGLAALYTLAGALVGAAFIAGVELGDLRGPAGSWTLAGLGTLAYIGGVMLRVLAPRQPWGDGLLVSAVVAYAFMLPASPVQDGLIWLALAASLPLPWLAGPTSPLPLLGPGLFTWAAFWMVDAWFSRPGFFFDEPTKTGVWLWVGLVAAFTVAAAVAGLNRLLRPWPATVAACAVALVAPVLLWTEEVLAPRGDGVPQLVLAVPEAALLAFGLLQRSGLVVGAAALVLAVDAVAFAFDVGGEVFGTVSLLLVAAVLVVLALTLRRQFTPAAPT